MIVIYLWEIGRGKKFRLVGMGYIGEVFSSRFSPFPPLSLDILLHPGAVGGEVRLLMRLAHYGLWAGEGLGWIGLNWIGFVIIPGVLIV